MKLKELPGEVFAPDAFLQNAKIEDFFCRDSPWQKDCRIICTPEGRILIRYQRPNAEAFNEESRQIAEKNSRDGKSYGYGSHLEEVFLRHSAGPRQGFFWDIYGENFQNFGLAIIAIMNAPCPVIHARTLPAEI